MRNREFKEAEIALSQSNLYDPLNGDTWGYLALNCLQDGSRFIQANQALREMMKLKSDNMTLLREVTDGLLSAKKNDIAEQCLKEMDKIAKASQKQEIKDQIHDIHLKLAKIYHEEARVAEATEEYQEALKYVQNSEDKEKIKTILETISNSGSLK
jgi:tetratricopeptide (TPR) repeat protein